MTVITDISYAVQVSIAHNLMKKLSQGLEALKRLILKVTYYFASDFLFFREDGVILHGVYRDQCH